MLYQLGRREEELVWEMGALIHLLGNLYVLEGIEEE